MSDDDFSFGDDGSSEYGNVPLSDYGTGQLYSLPSGSALASTSVDPTTGGLQSGQSDSSTSMGALASMFGGGTPTLGDNTGGGPTGSGALALTNGGGATGATVGGAGYNLDSSSEITHDVGAASSGSKSVMQSLADMVKDKDGNLDLSKLIKIGTGLGGVFAAYQKNKAAAASNAQQLGQAQVAQAAQTWTPAQAASAANYFGGTQNRTLVNPSAQGISSIVPASVTRPQVGYAKGGTVKDDTTASTEAENPIFAHILASIMDGGAKAVGNTPSPLMTVGAAGADNGRGLVPVSPIAKALPLLINNGDDSEYPLQPQTNGISMAEGGALSATAPGGALSHGTYGLVSGAGDGQSDSVPISAAVGEYMMDAETVSMLGNGDNNAGAQALDAWREALRAHKRDAPPDQIAPPTGPDQMPPMGAQ